MKTAKRIFTPTQKQVHDAVEHVAWEYAMFLAAALPKARYGPPVNHQTQESFLVHLRNLAEFFHQGTAEFRGNPAGALGPLPRGNDNIHAVDFCYKIGWDEKRLHTDTKLRRAINKTLSHLTYSRDLSSGLSEIDMPFDGPKHTHGSVVLIRRAWDGFMQSVRVEYQTELTSWVEKRATDLGISLKTFDDRFDKWAKECGWQAERNA
ncbi:MAG: hypothetical protein ABSC64_08890 [Candidatus Korobacteraceae bacterium]